MNDFFGARTLKVFADTADVGVMESLRDRVQGFTTNPTLCRAAGVTNYEKWGREVVARFPDHSLSFEVIGDDARSISEQAERMFDWSDEVYIKLPPMLPDGSNNFGLISVLSHNFGMRINVTAVFTSDQVKAAFEALHHEGYVSVFAGRIADAGHDPEWLIDAAAQFRPDHVEIVWASAREVLNIYQAERCGADIITLSPELIVKADRTLEKDLTEFSLETVQQFHEDAVAAGLTL